MATLPMRHSTWTSTSRTLQAAPSSNVSTAYGREGKAKGLDILDDRSHVRTGMEIKLCELQTWNEQVSVHSKLGLQEPRQRQWQTALYRGYWLNIGIGWTDTASRIRGPLVSRARTNGSGWEDEKD